jgi:hypothetical protein
VESDRKTARSSKQHLSGRPKAVVVRGRRGQGVKNNRLSARLPVIYCKTKGRPGDCETIKKKKKAVCLSGRSAGAHHVPNMCSGKPQLIGIPPHGFPLLADKRAALGYPEFTTPLSRLPPGEFALLLSPVPTWAVCMPARLGEAATAEPFATVASSRAPRVSALLFAFSAYYSLLSLSLSLSLSHYP